MANFICSARAYQYAGWTFETPAGSVPWPLKKDGALRERAGRKFYSDIKPFLEMSKKEQQKHCICDVGCVEF